MYVNRRAGSDLNIMVHKRCSYNSRSVPCLLVWVRGPAEQGRHNAITDSGPDDNTSKRSDGSAGYFLKSRVQRSLEGECVCVQALYLLSDPKKNHTANRPQAITVDFNHTSNRYLAIIVDFYHMTNRPQAITVDFYHTISRPQVITKRAVRAGPALARRP